MARSTTTLGAAVTTTGATEIAVSSATNISAGKTLQIDSECLSVIGVTGLIVRVMRGIGGTKAQKHASGATVYIGVAGQVYTALDPQNIGVVPLTAGASTTKCLSVTIDGTVYYIPLSDSAS